MTDNPKTTEQEQEFRPRISLDINQLKALRKKGLSLKEIGARLGVSAMTVRRHLLNEGESTSQTRETRRRVAETASHTRWGKETKSQAILRIWDENPDLPCRLIAKRAGASYSWTWNVLIGAGRKIAPDKFGRKPPDTEN